MEFKWPSWEEYGGLTGKFANPVMEIGILEIKKKSPLATYAEAYINNLYTPTSYTM